MLGPILDIYFINGHPSIRLHDARVPVKDAILRLLQLIQSADVDALNTQQRERLRRDLFHRGVSSDMGYWRGPEYCLSVLYALEQIGDKRDLPDIERLLKEHYITDEIRVAAERCAEVIRERVAREEGKDFLLRPERKPEAVDTLLRPSGERSDTPNKELLRASTEEEGEA